MARIDNAITFGSGFNISSTGPIDSRMRVEYESDLIDAATWPSDKAPLYDGMAVVVMETAEIWVLKDKTKFTDKTTGQGWVKSSGGGASTLPEPLCFTANERGCIISIINENGNAPIIEYSIDDKQTWATWDYKDIELSDEDDCVYMRGMNPNGFSYPNGFSLGEQTFSHFAVSGNTSVSGNIMSLIDYTQEITVIPNDYCFSGLFTSTGDSDLSDASGLILPATTLTEYCYAFMFSGCSDLTTSPKILPADTLADGCYCYMFSECASLTTAPELPATTLANGCYYFTFYSCISLTTAPELPATTLAGGCYQYMFSNCTSLTAVPKLPATALTNNCYESMFQGCTSLAIAPELPATTLANDCYHSMFYGCTSLTTAPELAATTLANSCYYYMFYGCTSLTTAPELPATTLAYRCYFYMLNGCNRLKYVKCLATDISATDCTRGWLSGVMNTGTFIKESAMTGWTLDSINGIPSGWSVYNHYTDIELDKKININVTVAEVLGVLNEGDTYPKTLCITNIDGVRDAIITLPIVRSEYEETHPDVKYSLDDGKTWVQWDYDNSTNNNIVLPPNKRVFLKGYNPNGFNYSTIVGSVDKFNTRQLFITGGSVEVSGNIMGLIDDGECATTVIPCTACFMELFCGSEQHSQPSIKYAKNLYLPALTLTRYCYCYMFYNCTGLTTVPELPATTLAEYCYNGTFYGCTSLTAAPELPATTLANDCYRTMFKGCTSLTTAPELPATTLTKTCYLGMFQDCNSLTIAPELPATTLADGCYGQMFMGCTSLTTAPELPATTLAESCYNIMFYNCGSLNYIKCLAVNGIDTNNSTYRWVSGVASSGTFVKHPDVSESTWGRGVNGIPTNWTVEDAVLS